ncbi:hypothetical protein HPB49_005810 [Dermacentor silvarum]|uniref:Uncharacterized protein n=1 Tax=Dermacentor silvarum TaxID=543639 RepID=A0ACB8D386_DERSI|nr:hypothetical protein HPB49_005810 [Dermacentor silvarum]
MPWYVTSLSLSSCIATSSSSPPPASPSPPPQSSTPPLGVPGVKPSLSEPWWPALCAYVMAWMAFYWVTELLPLPVTSLMPVVLFPLLDILPVEETTHFYFNDLGTVIFGSLLVVLGVKKTGLAKRIALRILYFVGTRSSRLLFVFMVICASLSMWLPNTSVTALVAPVAMAIVDQMKVTTKLKRRSLTRQSSSPQSVAYKKALEAIRISLSGLPDELIGRLQTEMVLSTAYSTSIGGFGTLSGTFPNLILKHLYEQLSTSIGRFPDAPPITESSWMAANMPAMITCLMFAWCCSNQRIKSIRTQELLVQVVLFCLGITWLNLPTGDLSWGESSMEPRNKIGLGVPTLVAGMVMFAIPRHQPRSFRPGLPYSPWKPVLTWQESCPHCHWGLLFLVSGGLTFARASQESGLSGELVRWMEALNGLNSTGVLTVLCLVSASLTEFFSNSAVSAVMLPVVLETIGHGLFLTALCVSVVIILTTTWARFVLDLYDFPTWAMDNATSYFHNSTGSAEDEISLVRY